MRKILSAFMLSTVLFLCFSCKKKEIEEQKISRAVLIYMVSENNLSRDSFDKLDINEILKATKDMKDDQEIILYLDDTKNPAIYLINNRTDGTMLSDLTPVYSYSEDHNSCSRQSLTDFLAYVKQNYPADDYGMVFWSHGAGWIPSYYSGDTQQFAKQRRSYGIDNGQNTLSNTGNQMCITDMKSALESFGQKFKFLFFDCCFMQGIETDFELQNVTEYIVGSPAEIPGPGANYTTIVPAFFEKTDYPKAIPEAYYEHYKNGVSVGYGMYYGVLISTVDCSQLNALVSATYNALIAHKEELTSMPYTNVLDYFIYDKWREFASFPDFYDMNGIFQTLLSEEEYTTWKRSFDAAVPYRYATDFWITTYPVASTRYVDQSQFGGVNMFVPLQKYSSDKYASSNAFFVNGYKSTSWAKALWGY